MTKSENRRKTMLKEGDSEGIFSGVLVLTLSNLVVKAVGLLFKIPMNYVVGDTGMGYYNAAYSIYTFFYMLSTAGLPVAVSIMISEARGRGRRKHMRQILCVAVVLFISIGLAGTLLLWTGADAFADWIGAPPAAASIVAIAPTMFFVCIASALRGYFQGCQKMTPTAVSQVIEALCKMTFGILGALYAMRQNCSPAATAAYAVCGLTIGTAFSMIYLIIAKCFTNDSERLPEIPFVSLTKKTILKRFAVIAFPVTISASVMSLTNMIDAVLIQKLLQDCGMAQEMATTAYGNYTSLAVPMFNLPPVLVYPIAYSIVPLITRFRISEQNEKAENVMRSSLRMAAIIGMPCALGLSVLAEPILSMFYRAESAGTAAPLLTLLAPSSFFVCLLAITNSILQAVGKADKPVYAMLCGAAVKIAASHILIRKYGMIGAPLSTFLCYTAVTILNLYFVQRYTGLSLSAGNLYIKPLLASIVCAVTAWVSYGLFCNFLPENAAVLLSVMAAVLIYVPVVLRTGVLTEADLSFVPKKEKIIALLRKYRMLAKKEIEDS